MDARRFLQYAGVAATMVIGVSAILDTQASVGHRLLNPVSILQFVLLLLFASAFWFNTQQSLRLRPRLSAALVVLQVLLILLFLSSAGELVFVVAAEIPLIVRGRNAFWWLGGIIAFICLMSVIAVYAGDFSIGETVAHTPRPIAIALSIAMMLAWTCFAFSAGYLILKLEESRDATEWAKAQLEGSQQLLTQTARIGERLRISRELHDTIGHHLTGLAINLEIASQVTNEAALTPIHRAQLVAKMLLAETRELIQSMRGDQSLELRPAIEQLGSAMKTTACHLEIAPDLVVGPAAARALFRCAQEAMTNASRHAKASNFWLEIKHNGDRILFNVRDDGRGSPNVMLGNGLLGMRERLAELGGALEVESAPARGFSLRGWIPAGASES